MFSALVALIPTRCVQYLVDRCVLLVQDSVPACCAWFAEQAARGQALAAPQAHVRASSSAHLALALPHVN